MCLFSKVSFIPHFEYLIDYFKDAKRPFAATVANQQQPRYASEAEYGIVAVPDDYQVRNVQKWHFIHY